jgi:negative regulator of flagellin synthesis FlgM
VSERIKGTDSLSIGSGSRGLEPVTRAAPVAPPAPVQPEADNVYLTGSARSMAALAQAVFDAPEIDAGRVQELQQSIQNGSYRIDAGRIADRLMQLEQDLS